MTSERKDFGTIRENEKKDNPESKKTDEQPDSYKRSSNADYKRNKEGIYGGRPEKREEEQTRR